MAHWPPQPIVEDEVTSLEHEQIPPSLVETLKSEDDPAVSRGAVDQYPIILDSDSQRNANRQAGKSGSEKTKVPAEFNSSDDSPGPTTPPPLYRKDGQRQNQPVQSVSGTSRETRYPPQVAPTPGLDARGRPQAMRIDTNLGADLHAMATGNRRAPSPYSYSRPSTIDNVAGGQQVNGVSPVRMGTSPNQVQADSKSQRSPMTTQDPRAVMSDEPDVSGRQRRRRRSRSRTRSRGQHRQSTSRVDKHFSDPAFSVPSAFESRQPSRRSTRDGHPPQPPTTSTKYTPDRQTYTPPQSRRQSRESYPAARTDERATHRLSRFGRDDHSAYESPYTSSAEDNSKNRRIRREQPLDPNDGQRRASTRRPERLHVDGAKESGSSRKSVSSSFEDGTSYGRDRNRRSYQEPLTSWTADGTKSFTNYLEQAMHDNEIKKSRAARSQQGSGSTAVSPYTSPPRTPRVDRHGRDYFDLDPAFQRPIERSRPPSMDEGQVAGIRSHASLVSAATAGAALAARASNEPSQANKGGNTPKSRRPSPVLEEHHNLARSASMTQTDLPHIPYATGWNQKNHLDSRGHGQEWESTSSPQPHRSASYSTYDQPRTVVNPNVRPGQEFNGRNYPGNGNLPNLGTARPSPYLPPSTQAAQQTLYDLRLPQCPRPKPVSGYHDWYSVKEISNLDFCPTCTSVLRTTRYNHLFVPSLPRPYNEPSVCAMSKPWLRIAFMRAFRQGMPDLQYLSNVSNLPEGTKPCPGDRSDLRTWFYLFDPATNEPVPNFVVCSACTRAVDKIFPQLEHLLRRTEPALNQEGLCSLRSCSKHFTAFIDQLDQADIHIRERGRRSLEIQTLAAFFRKACRYQECARDKFLPTRAWHFMTDFPEFTICEECYEEVVWPISNKPIARDISKVTKIVPVTRNVPSTAGLSCQLYSDRMRKLFLDAVAGRNFAQLRDAARTRQATQQRLQEINRLYEADQKYGIDRRNEIEKNNAIWRTLE